MCSSLRVLYFRRISEDELASQQLVTAINQKIQLRFLVISAYFSIRVPCHEAREPSPSRPHHLRDHPSQERLAEGLEQQGWSHPRSDEQRIVLVTLALRYK